MPGAVGSGEAAEASAACWGAGCAALPVPGQAQGLAVAKVGPLLSTGSSTDDCCCTCARVPSTTTQLVSESSSRAPACGSHKAVSGRLPLRTESSTAGSMQVSYACSEHTRGRQSTCEVAALYRGCWAASRAMRRSMELAESPEEWRLMPGSCTASAGWDATAVLSWAAAVFCCASCCRTAAPGCGLLSLLTGYTECSLGPIGCGCAAGRLAGGCAAGADPAAAGGGVMDLRRPRLAPAALGAAGDGAGAAAASLRCSAWGGCLAAPGPSMTLLRSRLTPPWLTRSICALLLAAALACASEPGLRPDAAAVSRLCGDCRGLGKA